jgi:hypothetical protein
MRIDLLLFDLVLMLTVLIGFCLIPVIQCKYNARYIQRLTRKVGPEYWGSLYSCAENEISDDVASIKLYPPCREMQNNYGRQA